MHTAGGDQKSFAELEVNSINLTIGNPLHKAMILRKFCHFEAIQKMIYGVINQETAILMALTAPPSNRLHFFSKRKLLCTIMADNN